VVVDGQLEPRTIDLTERDRLVSPRTPFTIVADHWRNPMAIIGGMATTLLARWDDIEDAQKRRMIEGIDRAATDLRGWIEEVLKAADPT
jgi:hypothetical protein